MYERTQETIDAILKRNLENTAPASPAMVSYSIHPHGDHGWMVQFLYDNFDIKVFDGRKWS